MNLIKDIVDKELERLEKDTTGELSPEVGIEEFIESDYYLGNERSDWVWPAIKEELIEIFTKNEDGSWKYHEIVLDRGIGSGKGAEIAIATAYKTYLIENKVNPQTAYHFRPGSRLAIMNISLKQQQAIDIMFGDITATIELCKWFKLHEMMPDPSIKSTLRFPKDIYVIPGSSTDTAAVGYNLYTAIIDEAAWFPVVEGEDGDKAEEIYNQMTRRLKNRFPHDWLIMLISSPRYEDDFIERKLEEAQTDPGVFGVRNPSWKTIPHDEYHFPMWYKATMKREPAVFSYRPYEDIPIDYESDFRKNPTKALRDLGAIPSLVLEPFFEEYERVENNINKSRVDPLPEKVDIRGKQLPDSPKEQMGRLPEWFRGNGSLKYFLHVDLATGGRGGQGDRCGFCIGHARRIILKNQQLLPVGVIDLMTRFRASPHREIQFNEVIGFIIELKRRGFNIVTITFDGWQSIHSTQILRNEGFKSVEILSIGVDSYETMKEMIYDERLDYYEHKGFLYECKRLERREGRRVEKSARSTDDLSDSVAGVCHHIAESLIPPDKPRRKRVNPIVGMGTSRPAQFRPPEAVRRTYV